MRVIKFNKSAFEKEITCPSCRSIFMFNYHDMYTYTDMSGDKCPAVKCPCCGHGIDLEGYNDLPLNPYEYINIK